MCADKVVDAEPLRVSLFVDFSNFSSSLRHENKNFMTDWRPLGQVFTEEAGKVIGPDVHVSYQSMHVYGSYDLSSKKDRSFRKWVSDSLSKMPGVFVTLNRRQKIIPPPKCPSCKSDMRDTREKNVDAAIVTDMIKFAWSDAYDVAVIVSSDRSFIPVAEFLQFRGIKVIHASFPPSGGELSQKCWGNFEVPKLMSVFQRTKSHSERDA